MRKKRIKDFYLSGQITGCKNFRSIFAEAACHVQLLGHNPINPVFLGDYLETKFKRKPTWAEYMRYDVSILSNADAIVLLPNWTKSKGAKAEKKIAEMLEIPVYKMASDGTIFSCSIDNSKRPKPIPVGE